MTNDEEILEGRCVTCMHGSPSDGRQILCLLLDEMHHTQYVCDKYEPGSVMGRLD